MAVLVEDNILENIKMTADEFKMQMAIYLYKSEQLSSTKAGMLVGLSRMDFLYEMGSRKIPWNYGIDDFEEDLLTISRNR